MKNKFDQLVLRTEQGLSELESQNYLLDKNNQSREAIKSFADQYFASSLEEIKSLQDQLTKLHLEHEMNFQVKDKRGNYSKVVSTPVQGFAPISYGAVNKLVNSTKLVNQLIRRILQETYSKHDLNEVEYSCLGFSAEKISKLKKIVRENIYYD